MTGTMKALSSDAANETSASATDGELLPGLASAMEEDYFADTRAAACHAVAEVRLPLDADASGSTG